MELVLPVPSDWTNVINGILFEIMLVTLIFFLTADVCARLNYLALVDGSVQDLVVMSPPLVGGGVISTSRQRTLFMIVLRSLGIFLIFGTALTIDGDTIDVLLRSTKTMRSPGELPNLNMTGDVAFEAVNELIDLRYTCTVNYNNSMVFGHLEVEGYCETDDRLLQNAVSISSGLELTSRSFSSGCQTKKIPFIEKKGYVVESVITTCEQVGRKANVYCILKRTGSVVDFSNCVASLKLNPTKFAVCEHFKQVVQAPSVSINTSCHPAANLGDVQDHWQKAAEITRSLTIIDFLGAVSVAGKQTKEVERYEERDVTRLHYMWFLCLAIKLVLLLFLGLLSVHLRCRGARRVLNDDRALLSLLKQKLGDWIGGSNSHEQATIYLHLQTNEEGEKNVWASTIPNYNVAVSNPDHEA